MQAHRGAGRGGRRRRGSPAWVFALVLACLVAGAAPAAGAVASDSRATEAQLEALRSRIAALSAELGRSRDEHDRLRDRLRATETQIGALHRDLERNEWELAEARQRLAELAAARRAHYATLDGQREALAGQVRAAYAMGRQERLKLILNQQDPAQLGRLLGYYDYLNRARLERIGEIERLLEELAATERAVLAEEARIEALRDLQRQTAAALAAERGTRQELMAAIGAEIADKDRRLGRYRADEQRLQQLLESLQQVLGDMPAEAERVPFATRRGRLAWPASGRLGARFGEARRTTGSRWEGVRIDAEEGSAVRAVSHGRVAFADWLRGFGLLMILDHGDGYMSLYGYNQSLNKEVGDWVEEGEQVATVGNSGGNRQAGLYFEIRHRGRPVNPARWCRAEPGTRAG